VVHRNVGEGGKKSTRGDKRHCVSFQKNQETANKLNERGGKGDRVYTEKKPKKERDGGVKLKPIGGKT